MRADRGVAVWSRRLQRGVGRVAPFEVWPVSAWLVVALILPAGVFLVYSFWVTDLFGVHQTWTTAQYQTAFGDAFYRDVLLNTIGWAAVIAVVCVVIAYGTAYALTFTVGRRGAWVLLLIVGTALASYLVRIYAWLVILGPKGPINRGVALLGLSSRPLNFLLYTRFSVVVTLVCVCCFRSQCCRSMRRCRRWIAICSVPRATLVRGRSCPFSVSYCR